MVLNAFNLGAAIDCVPPEAGACSEVIIESGESAQKDILALASQRLAEKGISCQTRAEIGQPVEATLRVAEEEKADLIVLGNRGRSGFQALLLGSVSDGVARHALCPVLVVRGDTNRIRQILVVSDGSELSYKALQAASELARPLRAAIRVLNVLDSAKPFPGIDPAESDAYGYALLVREAISERVDAILKETGTEYRICQEKGHPVETITEFAAANPTDLIVMGSHGLGVFQRLLLGSVSYGVLHHAPCSVLIVR